jgi:PadR family transcriptional regulator PadR
MDSNDLPTEWVRAVLSMAVLSIVSEGETYGYVIAQRLQSAGLGSIRGGTLYPVLNRLESSGLLTSSWREGLGGPGRKFFAITTDGTAHLNQRAAAWHTFTEQAAGLLPDPRRTR